MELDNYQELESGDKITFKKVGSYTMALSPLFIEYFPDVYVEKENGNIIKIREKWGINEFLQNQNIKRGGSHLAQNYDKRNKYIIF